MFHDKSFFGESYLAGKNNAFGVKRDMKNQKTTSRPILTEGKNLSPSALRIAMKRMSFSSEDFPHPFPDRGWLKLFVITIAVTSVLAITVSVAVPIAITAAGLFHIIV